MGDQYWLMVENSEVGTHIGNLEHGIDGCCVFLDCGGFCQLFQVLMANGC